ncbi:hypothetical protein ACP0HM_05005 [Escherichia coli]
MLVILLSFPLLTWIFRIPLIARSPSVVVKKLPEKAKLNFTKSGNPYFAVFFNSHATEKEVVELVAYEGEEKERIESCEAFLELEAQVNAVSPVVEDRFAALEAQIAELKAALEEKDQIIEAQKAEIEELKAKEVAPVAVVEKRG